MNNTCSCRTALERLLCMLLVFSCYEAVQSKDTVWENYCNRMTSQAAKGLCLNYTRSDSAEDRVCTALYWRQNDLPSYYCAGINDACLSAEAKLSRGNHIHRVCSPYPEKTPCGSRLQADLGPRCVRGTCVDKRGNRLSAPNLPRQPVPSAARLGGSTTIRVLMTKTSSKSPKGKAVPDQDSITVDIDTKNLKRSIPHGFLGVSLEWNGIEYYGSPGHAWADVFRVLGPEPVIRIGGASQDKLKEVPGKESWAAMAKLHKEVGMRFIIGVPLNRNNPGFIHAMIETAKQHLPDEAIIGFELGNEPTYWDCPGLGGWDADDVFQPGWRPYASYFQRMAKKISGCDKGKGEKVLLGPGWDSLNTFLPQRYDDVLGSDSQCYLADLSLHYYPYYKKNTFDSKSLLSEDLMREAQRNATQHVNSAASKGHSLRITEANSMSGAGEEGTSDAYAAALWTADLAFEFASAGVKSLALHWGSGGLPGGNVPGGGGVPVYAGIRTYHKEDGTAAPSVRAPWYGYLLFQAVASPRAAAEADPGLTTAGGQPGRFAPLTAAVATPSCSRGQIKIWPVLHASSPSGRTELRVAVLNKSDKDDCLVTLQLKDTYGDGKLMRVQPDESSGPGRMTSKKIRFGGATYKDMSGKLTGDVEAETIKAGRYAMATAKKPGTKFSFNMPRASAAVFVTQDRKRVVSEAGPARTDDDDFAVGPAEDVDTISSLYGEEQCPFDESSDVDGDEELAQLEKVAAEHHSDLPLPSSLDAAYVEY